MIIQFEIIPYSYIIMRVLVIRLFDYLYIRILIFNPYIRDYSL